MDILTHIDNQMYVFVCACVHPLGMGKHVSGSMTHLAVTGAHIRYKLSKRGLLYQLFTS